MPAAAVVGTELHLPMQIVGREAGTRQCGGADQYQDSPMAWVRGKEGCAGVQQVCDPDRPASIRFQKVAGAILRIGTAARRIRCKEASAVPFRLLFTRPAAFVATRGRDGCWRSGLRFGTVVAVGSG